MCSLTVSLNLCVQTAFSVVSIAVGVLIDHRLAFGLGGCHFA
jgi:hypothetical protein